LVSWVWQISSGIGPIGWRIVKILRQRRKKTTNTEPTTLSAIKASSQSTFINEHFSLNNYTPLVISRNDKNKQLTLLSQRKLTLTAINKLLHYKTTGAPEKFKNQTRPLVRLCSVNCCQNLFNLYLMIQSL
jgi:hypothetical protein